ncbi:MAG: ATP-binding cassette domain-containing protein [Solirubrobacterales bacterium]
MIVTEALTKSFGKTRAVQQVSIHVEEGQIYGLVGPDGAGKTTLMRMICGLITPDSGRVRLLGNGNPDKADFGYMPQRFSLYGDLTVMENISFFGSMYKIDKKTIQKRAAEVLELTRLAPFADRFADNLSGGMKQKLALTSALITRPKLLVLDEPTYGVDPESRKEFWKILYRLNKEGMTVMVSTPYMDEAELCSVVAFMSQGRIMAVDTPIKHKQDFPGRLLAVRAVTRDPDLFNGMPGVQEISFYGDRFHLVVDDPERAIPAAASWLAAAGVQCVSIQEVAPSMEDLFVSLTRSEVS